MAPASRSANPRETQAASRASRVSTSRDGAPAVANVGITDGFFNELTATFALFPQQDLACLAVVAIYLLSRDQATCKALLKLRDGNLARSGQFLTEGWSILPKEVYLWCLTALESPKHIRNTLISELKTYLSSVALKITPAAPNSRHLRLASQLQPHNQRESHDIDIPPSAVPNLDTNVFILYSPRKEDNFLASTIDPSLLQAKTTSLKRLAADVEPQEEYLEDGIYLCPQDGCGLCFIRAGSCRRHLENKHPHFVEKNPDYIAIPESKRELIEAGHQLVGSRRFKKPKISSSCRVEAPTVTQPMPPTSEEVRRVPDLHLAQSFDNVEEPTLMNNVPYCAFQNSLDFMIDDYSVLGS